MTRNLFLDFTKAVLIMLVLIGHSLQYFVYRNAGFWGDPLFKLIYMFHMPLFMGVAGYLSWHSVSRSSSATSIINAAASYVVPILVWEVLYRLVISTAGRHSSFGFHPGELVDETSFNLWFLWALFGSIALTALVKQVAGRLFATGYILSFLGVLLLPNVESVPLFKYTYPFFQLGYVVAGGGLPSFFVSQRAAISGLALAAFAVCFYFWGYDTYIYNSGMELSIRNEPNICLRYGAAVVGSTFALYTLFFIYERLPEAAKRTCFLVGRDTVYIYVVSMYVFVFVNRFIRYHATRSLRPMLGLTGGWVLSAVLAVIICALCWGFGVVASRSVLLARLLFGKKPKQTLQMGSVR